jgi:hypothetical protein
VPTDTLIPQTTLVRLNGKAVKYGLARSSFRLNFQQGDKRPAAGCLKTLSRTEFAARLITLDDPQFFYAYCDGRHLANRTARLNRKPIAPPNAIAEIVLTYPQLQGIIIGSVAGYLFTSCEPQALAPLFGALSGLATVATSRMLSNPFLGILLAAAAGLMTQEVFLAIVN